MFGRLLEDVLHQVTEVIVPSTDTPIDKFKYHWKCIKSFYIDKKCNNYFFFLK